MVNGGRDMINWKRDFDGDELTRVETCAVEFDWIFCGNNAISFIQHLAHRADESIFAVETIRVIVLFLWDRFFFHIRNKILLPFLGYFALFIFEVVYVREHRQFIIDCRNGFANNDPLIPDNCLDHSEEDEKAWTLTNNILVGFLLGFWVYFVLIELKQVCKLGKEYFSEFWNWLDMMSLTINCSYFICSFIDIIPENQRVQASCAILLMWLKMLYFLRLFSHTASLIRMVVQILKDMIVFTVIYFMVLIGFANAFFLLAYNLDPAN